MQKLSKALSAVISARLLKFSAAFGGVPLCFESLIFTAPNARLLPDSEFILFPVRYDLVVFSVQAGDRIVGKVNSCGNDHFSFLVYGLFFGTVQRVAMPEDFLFMTESRTWMTGPGQVIGEGTHVLVKVEAVQTKGGILHLEASFLDEDLGILEMEHPDVDGEATAETETSNALSGAAAEELELEDEEEEEEEEESTERTPRKDKKKKKKKRKEEKEEEEEKSRKLEKKRHKEENHKQKKKKERQREISDGMQDQGEGDGRQSPAVLAKPSKKRQRESQDSDGSDSERHSSSKSNKKRRT